MMLVTPRVALLLMHSPLKPGALFARRRPLVGLGSGADLTLRPPTLTRLDYDGALYQSAMNNLGAARATRRSLRERLFVVDSDDVSTAAAAGHLKELLSTAYTSTAETDSQLSHEHTGTDVTQTREYFEHFKSRGYNMGGCELTERSAVQLLSLLQLSSSDRFVDLGSATGRLVLAAAALTPARALGVELSPSRHERASTALGRLADPAARGRVTLQRGDLVDARLGDATVVWCAVRPLSGRKLGTELVARVRAALPAGVPARLFLAGFALPGSADAELRAAYVFAQRDGSGPETTQLYGGALGGPSTVVEYEVVGDE